MDGPTATNARGALDQLIGKGSRNQYLGHDGNGSTQRRNGAAQELPEEVKDLNRKAITAFVKLMAKGHGDDAGAAAFDKLKRTSMRAGPCRSATQSRFKANASPARSTRPLWKRWR